MRRRNVLTPQILQEYFWECERIDGKQDINCLTKALNLHIDTELSRTLRIDESPETPRIYIAGPMSGVEEYNFPAFFRAEEMLTDMGFDVINPARRDVEAYNFEWEGKNGIFDDIATICPEWSLRDAFRFDMVAICHCHAIYMLKGWQHSGGARAEHALASVLRLKFYYQEIG